MKLTVTLGVDDAFRFPLDCTVKTVEVDIGPEGVDGIDPEAVFRAANRIDEPDVDLANLPHPWQQALRLGIDLAESPSMSVGDTFTLAADDGRPLGAMRVDRVGWSTLIQWSVPS